ncbi:MAG: DEAD/DEAH box helicase family protein, partial [Planctomycetota bacterium]
MKMKTWPEDVKFKLTWRQYQARVLEQLKQHLDDDHLHIIAAPGSGKTVLGLEVARRLNKPTLVFSPTLTIRDQWIDRLVTLFCNVNLPKPTWISKNIKKPAFFTASTYQGLHAAYTGLDELLTDEEDDLFDQQLDFDIDLKKNKILGADAVIARLKKLEIGTLILDEAHHLRNEWWKCLIDLKGQLDNLTVVALTATPPFDVSIIEWDRYLDLCGPVDAEISVPELVLQKNLCPHQDYVYISNPLNTEITQIAEFRKDVELFTLQLCNDKQFISNLEDHPSITEPEEHIEQLYEYPDFYLSIASFLNHVNEKPPKKLLKALGVSLEKSPKIDLEWMQILLTGLLYAHNKTFPALDENCEQIAQDLKSISAIENRKVKLKTTDWITRLLVSSNSKLDSITDIIEIENQSLASDLRLVILTDFIRKNDFPKNADDKKPPRRIGVVPIFEQIRNGKISGIKLGILCGTLVVIPSDSKELLEKIAKDIAIDTKYISYLELPHDENYCTIQISGTSKKKIVTLITRLFAKGGITVLVGTKSLLGEGWDAPCINSLILASFVGSYMLSNQMRGRAIRTMQTNPGKTANIWHLVCIEKDTIIPSDDMEMLARRFNAFEGVHATEPIIINGIERLQMTGKIFTGERIKHLNKTMVESAKDRDALREKWHRALESAEDGSLHEAVTSTSFNLPRTFVFKNTILALFWQGIAWGTYIFTLFMRGYERLDLTVLAKNAFLLIGIAFGVAAIAAFPKCAKALVLLIKHGPIASSMKQIAKALLESMFHAKLIKTNIKNIKIVTKQSKKGIVNCSLRRAKTYEKYIFLDAMQEILSPIENPRYILVRKTRLWKLTRKDYHVVPTMLGRKREIAEHFANVWRQYVGPTELLYT